MIKVYKNGISRDITKSKLEEYKQAGWTDQESLAKDSEEVIRLKPAKSKGADKSLDNANLTQGEDDGYTNR
jgi:hypothetical protein